MGATSTTASALYANVTAVAGNGPPIDTAQVCGASLDAGTSKTTVTVLTTVTR